MFIFNTYLRALSATIGLARVNTVLSMASSLRCWQASLARHSFFFLSRDTKTWTLHCNRIFSTLLQSHLHFFLLLRALSPPDYRYFRSLASSSSSSDWLIAGVSQSTRTGGWVHCLIKCIDLLATHLHQFSRCSVVSMSIVYCWCDRVNWCVTRCTSPLIEEETEREMVRLQHEHKTAGWEGKLKKLLSALCRLKDCKWIIEWEEKKIAHTIGAQAASTCTSSLLSSYKWYICPDIEQSDGLGDSLDSSLFLSLSTSILPLNRKRDFHWTRYIILLALCFLLSR